MKAILTMLPRRGALATLTKFTSATSSSTGTNMGVVGGMQQIKQVKSKIMFVGIIIIAIMRTICLCSVLRKVHWIQGP
jgi:poly(3-hydroxyalkanoate) synthetase